MLSFGGESQAGEGDNSKKFFLLLGGIAAFYVGSVIVRDVRDNKDKVKQAAKNDFESIKNFKIPANLGKRIGKGIVKDVVQVIAPNYMRPSETIARKLVVDLSNYPDFHNQFSVRAHIIYPSTPSHIKKQKT
jgi:hypothetical protein